jgi:hypothetical protein
MYCFEYEYLHAWFCDPKYVHINMYVCIYIYVCIYLYKHAYIDIHSRSHMNSHPQVTFGACAQNT